MTVLERLMLLFWKKSEELDNKRIATLTATPGMHEIRDIAYLDDGERGHLLDVYYPQGTQQPLPVIIDIHGGGFMYGYKELNRLYNLYLASLGFTVFSISYRLAPQVRVPDQLRDVNAAFHWIAQNVPKDPAQYPCDMQNCFVTGDSAGGFLALYGALLEKSPLLQELFGVSPSGLPIRALGLISGVADFRSPLGKILAKPALGRGYKKEPYYPCWDCSQIPETAQLPPVYMATSAQDFVRKHAHFLARILDEKGVPYQLHDWPKTPERYLQHVFSICYPTWPESVQTSAEMTQWFRKYSKILMNNGGSKS